MKGAPRITGRVLVVDDDPDVSQVLKDILETGGHRVEKAGTGTEAIRKVAADSFDLALVDIKLPDMEGTEVLRRMKETSARGMKKIIVTGYPSLENAIESITHGVDAYLLKPVDPKDLLQVVEDKLIEKKDAEAFIERAVNDRVKAMQSKLGLKTSQSKSRRSRRPEK